MRVGALSLGTGIGDTALLWVVYISNWPKPRRIANANCPATIMAGLISYSAAKIMP